MITEMELYWILRLDEIRIVLYHLIGLSGFSFFALGLLWGFAAIQAYIESNDAR